MSGTRERPENTVLISPVPWRPPGNIHIQKGMGGPKDTEIAGASLAQPRGVPRASRGRIPLGAIIVPCRPLSLGPTWL